jgi:hypothetical protein
MVSGPAAIKRTLGALLYLYFFTLKQRQTFTVDNAIRIVSENIEGKFQLFSMEHVYTHRSCRTDCNYGLQQNGLT